MFARPPRDPRLRGIVETLWIGAEGKPSAEPRFERILPTGAVHLVVRFGDPLRIDGNVLDGGIVGGSRSEAYVREVSAGRCSVGAQLVPGAASCLLGVPAVELAERHTPLSDLWGREASEWRERLAELPCPEKRLDRFEGLLASRVSAGPHRVAGWALDAIARGMSVGEIAHASGFSHRHFLSIFRREVGLAPKRWARVARFQRAIAALSRPSAPSLAEVAHAAGYSDQAHLTREFSAMAGLSPGRYLASPRRHPNHVSWVNSVQDGDRARGQIAGTTRP